MAQIQPNPQRVGVPMQKKKIDPGLIRVLVAEGLSDQEIAARMGWTVGTLYVRCSQLKISLRRSAIWKNAPRLALPKGIFDQLQQHAILMGVSESELVTDLLKLIVQDELYKAVLGREMKEAAN